MQLLLELLLEHMAICQSEEQECWALSGVKMVSDGVLCNVSGEW